MALAGDPVARLCIAFKVPISIGIATLEKLEEWVSEGRVHTNGFSWMVAPDAVSCETFLEKSLLVRAAAVELA
jgi:6,7-dimethyl-8-ribityllumazine synthase